MRFWRFVFMLIMIISVVIALIIFPARSATRPHFQILSTAFRTICESTCWHGIVLGKTTVAEAKNILSADPAVTMLSDDINGCQIKWSTLIENIVWQGNICVGNGTGSATPVRWIDLYTLDRSTDTQFTLFDAALLWGTPLSAGCDVFYSIRSGSAYSARVAFKGGIQVGAEHNLPYQGTLYDPLLPIRWIRFNANETPNSASMPWRGFRGAQFDNQGNNPCGISME